MANFIRIIICSLAVFIVFWSMGFTSELSLSIIIYCSVALGYGLKMFWDLYRKFQVKVEDRR